MKKNVENPKKNRFPKKYAIAHHLVTCYTRVKIILKFSGGENL